MLYPILIQIVSNLFGHSINGFMAFWLAVSIVGFFMADCRKSLRDTANFSYEYNSIKTFRTTNSEIIKEVVENKVLHVVNNDRVKWIMSELKPF